MAAYCATCMAEFEPYVSTQMYCCARCRMAAHERQRAPRPPRPGDRHKPGRPTQPASGRHHGYKPWLAIDTEGVTDTAGQWGPPGRHYPMVVTAANDEVSIYLYRGRPLTTPEILAWMCDELPQRYKLCGFFFAYDQSMIFHTMPETMLRELWKPPAPIIKTTDRQVAYWEGFIVERFASKLTVIRPDTPIEGPIPEKLTEIHGHHRVVWDTGKFYNMSLLSAIEAWQVATPGETAIITEMKGKRGNFDVAYWTTHAQQIIDYSLLENRLLCRLQTKFDLEARNEGYPLSSWYGAGSMAKSMLKHEGIRDHIDQANPIPSDMWSAVDWSYYGGRFEIASPGRVDTDVWEYDISSAYPSAYRHLPCLQHGTWTYRKKHPTTIGDHDLCHVKWDTYGAAQWQYGPFPQRWSGGSINYPQTGEGWVWGIELAAAKAIFGRQIHVYDIWKYTSKCDCQPWEWITKPYHRRKELGKNAAGYPLKIGMNACYGSVVSILSPAYFHPCWGSLITAYCRAQLLTALALCEPGECLMFATDAIYTTRQLALPLGKELGLWEEQHYGPGGLLIQPGLYYLPGADLDKEKLKTRGIHVQDVMDNLPRFFEAWDRDGSDGAVELPLRSRFVGVANGLRLGLDKTAWRWHDDLVRTIRFDPGIKRWWNPQINRWLPGTPPWGSIRIPYKRFVAYAQGNVMGPVKDEMVDSMLIEDQPEGEYV